MATIEIDCSQESHSDVKVVQTLVVKSYTCVNIVGNSGGQASHMGVNIVATLGV